MSAITVIFEIMACAAAGALASYFIMERREARHFAAAKAEELYTLIESFDQGLDAFLARVCALVADGAGFPPPDDGDWSQLMRDSARARMLVSFYYPTLWPQVRRADAAVAAAFDAMRVYRARRRDENARLALEQSHADMRETMETLKHAVVLAHRDSGRTLSALRPRTIAPRPALGLAA